MKLGIMGCGFSGRAIGRRLADRQKEVWGTTRSAENFAALKLSGVHPIAFDGANLNAALLEAAQDTTHLVISIAPPRRESENHASGLADPVLSALGPSGLKDYFPQLRWIGYLSTVGVYGNHDGAWIDEDTSLKPVSERSRQRVKAENEWLEAGRVCGIPVAIFRLSGIYGPGRNALVTANKGRSRRLVKPGQVFNRIHVGDIAQAVDLAAHANASGNFNITDDEPAPPQDVVSFAHKLLGTEPPPEMDFETADLSPMARSFYGENKRVSNARSKHMLGMVYQWPNYRVALQKMIDDDCWRG